MGSEWLTSPPPGLLLRAIGAWKQLAIARTEPLHPRAVRLGCSCFLAPGVGAKSSTVTRSEIKPGSCGCAAAACGCGAWGVPVRLCRGKPGLCGIIMLWLPQPLIWNPNLLQPILLANLIAAGLPIGNTHNFHP